MVGIHFVFLDDMLFQLVRNGHFRHVHHPRTLPAAPAAQLTITMLPKAGSIIPCTVAAIKMAAATARDAAVKMQCFMILLWLSKSCSFAMAAACSWAVRLRYCFSDTK